MVKAKSFANNLILDHFLQLKNILLKAMSNPNIDLNPAQWSFRGNSSDISNAINAITSRFSSDRGNIINGYSATKLVVDQFLANPKVTNQQLIQISRSTLDKFSADDSTVPTKYSDYATKPGHLMAVDAFYMLTGNPKGQVSTKLNGLGFTGTSSLLITYAENNPALLLGTIEHDLTDYLQDAGVADLNTSLWGIADKAASALVMFAETLVSGYIPSEEEIFNVMGTRQLPTREMELRQTVTRLGNVSSTLATKLAMHYGNEDFGSQLIAATATKTLGGWLGDNLAYQLASVGSSIPARALYTRLYGNFTNTLLGFGSSAISQAFSEKFDIEDPLAQIAIDQVTASLTNHIFSGLTEAAFGKSFAVNYLGVDPYINLSLTKASIIGEVVNTGFGALQSFASTQLFNYVDKVWTGADLNNFGASIGGVIGGFIAPGIGNFLGSVIGGWAWDLIFDKDPRAYYSVYYNVAAGKFVSQFSFSADGGKTEVAQQMAQSASDTLQLIAGMIGGTPLSITATEYGHYEKEFVFNVGGSGRNSFSSIQSALDNGIIRQLKTLNIQAGDPYMKRLIALPSYNSDLKGLFTDLGVAKEYSVHKVDPILYGQAIVNIDNADARKYLLDDWRRVQTRAKELTLDALPGDDGSEFIVGSDGSDDINAGVGNDLIYSDRGIDIINGGDGNDLLIIDYSSNQYAGSNVHPAGIYYYDGFSQSYTCYYDDKDYSYDKVLFYSIEQFQITGTNGSDYIGTRDGNDTINGGGGNDTIEGGLGNDVINGGDGNDAIAAGGGSDVINAGAGDDTVSNVSDDDIIDGGTGLDTISDLNYASSNSAIILNELGSTATLLGTNIKNIERFGSVILGSGNDTINFTSRLNNQEINTGKGNDTINAGLGIDIINGGDGNDLLIIDYSSNQYAGSNVHPAGIYYYDGFSQSYTCYYDDKDYSYDKVLFYSIEQFQITGTNGSDYIGTRDGNDTINGGGGNDTIEGGLGNDVINGGDGNDAIAAGGGSDVINAGAGDDTVANVSGDDIIDGGTGLDTISDLNYASSNSAIILNELGSAATLLGTNIKNIERFGSVILGSGNDKIEFSSRFNNQEINSGQGNDTINGGLGIDIISGGDGNDLLIIDYSSNLFAGSTNYQGGIFYEFGGYYERYTCSYSNENFDQIRFSDIEQFQITGTNGSDHIVTRDGNDTINGGGGNDTIEGGLGNDVISGGDGNDAIDAGGGSDVISGVKTGSANPGKNEIDILAGGEGRDTFILGDATSIFYDDGNTTNTGTSDYATIADFNPTDDIIQIRGSSIDYLLTVSGSNTNLYINKPGSEPDELIAVINNQTALSLTASYFSYGSSPTLPSITLAVSPSSVTEDGTTNLVYTFTRTGV
ncbi:calcium-binding protein, partial [Microcystis aeruginosa BLCCF158]|nr:calcium-binding protein [Microcystis aeruginosa BLCC-F158]